MEWPLEQQFLGPDGRISFFNEKKHPRSRERERGNVIYCGCQVTIFGPTKYHGQMRGFSRNPLLFSFFILGRDKAAESCRDTYSTANPLTRHSRGRVCLPLVHQLRFSTWRYANDMLMTGFTVIYMFECGCKCSVSPKLKMSFIP